LQSSKHVEDGVKLGCWINYQRKAKKKGTLYPKRITRLEKLSIVWDYLAYEWELKFQLLCNFYKRKGHCNPPTLHIEDEIKLGGWVVIQRKKKRKEVWILNV